MVRTARQSDLDPIIELLKEFYLEQSTFTGERIDPVHTRNYLEHFLTEGEFVFLVSDNGDGPYAFFIGFMGDNWITPDRSLTEMCLYVHPDQRGTLTACNLISYAEEVARMRNCKRFTAGGHAAVDPRIVARLYKSMGFTPRGSGYSKELNV